MTEPKLDFIPQEVTERHERVAVVCSGPSIGTHGFKPVFPDNVAVIAVNGAIRFCKPNYWFTLDQSPSNQEIMRHRRPGCKYYSARGISHCGPIVPGVFHLQRVGGKLGDVTVVEYGLPTDPSKIHTGNSGWGAFQVAVHMKARKIALFGVDGHGGYSFSGGAPRNLTMLPVLFESALPQLGEWGVEVRNGSPDSLVKAFPRTTPQEARDWLCN